MTPEIHLELKQSQEIAALSVQTEPAGAAILLDGKPPQAPPNTFTHVPFGPHQLSATLDNYEPFKQDLQVRRGMSPEIRLELKPESGNRRSFRPNRTGRRLNPVGRQAAAGTPKYLHSRSVWAAPAFGHPGQL